MGGNEPKYDVDGHIFHVLKVTLHLKCLTIINKLITFVSLKSSYIPEIKMIRYINTLNLLKFIALFK